MWVADTVDFPGCSRSGAHSSSGISAIQMWITDTADFSLTKHKCALHVGQPSTTIEKSYRTVFVWNLNPVNLYLLTTADGIDADETLLDKMNLMKDDLASSLQARGMKVKEIHLAQKDPNRRPTTMRMTS